MVDVQDLLSDLVGDLQAEPVDDARLRKVLQSLSGKEPGDPAVLELAKDNYRTIHDFAIAFKQQDDRDTWILFVQTLLTAGELDPHVYTVCAQHNAVNSCLPALYLDDEELLFGNCLLLSRVLSCGVPLPPEDTEQLTESTCKRLLALTEQFANANNESILPEIIRVIAAMNLHFDPGTSNNFVKALTGTDSRVFSEELLLIFNRGETSVSRQPMLKLLMDIFNNKATADLFYTNDIKVLIDVIIRELNNIEAEDVLRGDYLAALFPLLINTNYQDELYRAGDLHSVIEDMYAAEWSSEDCKEMCEAILLECPFLQSDVF